MVTSVELLPCDLLGNSRILLEIDMFITDLDVGPRLVAKNGLVIAFGGIISSLKINYFCLTLYSWVHFFLDDSNRVPWQLHLCYAYAGRPTDCICVNLIL